MISINKKAPSFYQTAYCKGEFITVNSSDYQPEYDIDSIDEHGMMEYTHHGFWLVLFFYPRDFTFICPTEIKGFQKHEAEFTALNAKVLGVSTDSEWSHKAWFEKDLPEITYPIIADTTHTMSKDYGVLNEDDGSSDRGLFIIDPTGVVKYALVSAGSVGRSVKEVLRVLTALQSGELCPMEWEPGEATLGKA